MAIDDIGKERAAVLGEGIIRSGDLAERPLFVYLAISSSRRRRRHLLVSADIAEWSRAKAYAMSGSAAMFGGGTSESANS